VLSEIELLLACKDCEEIVRLQAAYETPEHIYLVLELYGLRELQRSLVDAPYAE
jgi:hypothetical protein